MGETDTVKTLDSEGRAGPASDRSLARDLSAAKPVAPPDTEKTRAQTLYPVALSCRFILSLCLVALSCRFVLSLYLVALSCRLVLSL